MVGLRGNVSNLSAFLRFLRPGTGALRQAQGMNSAFGTGLSIVQSKSPLARGAAMVIFDGYVSDDKTTFKPEVLPGVAAGRNRPGT